MSLRLGVAAPPLPNQRRTQLGKLADVGYVPDATYAADVVRAAEACPTLVYASR
jgi:hypothetical protein